MSLLSNMYLADEFLALLRRGLRRLLQREKWVSRCALAVAGRRTGGQRRTVVDGRRVGSDKRLLLRRRRLLNEGRRQAGRLR